jgi:hypothetical protein
LNNRTFSIAMTAWSAKVWSSAISSSVNPPAASGHAQRADCLAVTKERHQDETVVAAHTRMGVPAFKHP